MIKYFIIILAFYALSNCSSDCDGCGGCDYVEIEGSFVITKVKKEHYNEYYYLFEDTTNSNITFYISNEGQLNNALTSYNLDTTRIGTNSIFKIYGERIIKGSCSPESIDSIIQVD